MTDEECIATAALHGAIFYGWKKISGFDSYIVCSEWEWNNVPSCDVEYATKGLAARKYCERHKLLEEVTP